MTLYYFDLRSTDSFSKDEEGSELSDAGAAHDMAVDALVTTIQDGCVEGSTAQFFAVEVRNHVGPILEVTAVFSSMIFRKQ